MDVDVAEIAGIQEDRVRRCPEIRMQIRRRLAVARDVNGDLAVRSAAELRGAQSDGVRTRIDARTSRDQLARGRRLLSANAEVEAEDLLPEVVRLGIRVGVIQRGHREGLIDREVPVAAELRVDVHEL